MTFNISYYWEGVSFSLGNLESQLRINVSAEPSSRMLRGRSTRIRYLKVRHEGYAKSGTQQQQSHTNARTRVYGYPPVWCVLYDS